MTTTELHALRAVIRHWHDSLVAEAQRPIDDMREWTDTDWADSGWTSAEADAIRSALTEDTPDPGTDGELIAAHDTPVEKPVCATCGGTRIKPWKLLTDNEVAAALRTIWHRTGTSIPCPDCTEDTTDADA